MKSIIPNLFIENCEENLRFYQGVFGGEIKNVVPNREMPGKLMHAELHVNEQCVLFFGDAMESAKPSANIHIFMGLETEEEITKIYDGLKENATVIYELQKTFWGSLHGVILDKNGIIWDLDM